jgi:hypothetical protein
MSIEEREAHKRFLKRLDGSRPAMFRVAEWLHKKGYDVGIPAIRYRKFEDKIEDFVDSGDVFARKDGKKYRFEIKHISYDFTSAEDWPVKQKTMLVSNKAAVERENGKATAFVVVNKPMTHVAIIWRHTRKHWFPDRKFATNTQRWEDFYSIKTEHVDFRSMSDD